MKPATNPPSAEPDPRRDPRMKVELHCHSTCSDGQLSPSELVRRAAERGVSVLALTDHDTTSGLAEAQACASECGVTWIAGIEFSISEDAGRTQLHLLGYGLDPRNEELSLALEQVGSARVRRAARTLELLAEQGIALDLEAVLSRSPDGTIGRPHIAAALTEAGVCSGPQEAFARFLRRGRPAFVPSPGLSAGRAIALIHRAGGIASLAHPFLSAGLDAAGGIERFLGRLVHQGLDAVEVFHPKHKKAQRQRLRQLAQRYELLITGGSDFHGTKEQSTPLGSQSISGADYERLAARLGAVSNASA